MSRVTSVPTKSICLLVFILGFASSMSGCKPESSFAAGGRGPSVPAQKPKQPQSSDQTQTTTPVTTPTPAPVPVQPIAPPPANAVVKGSFTVWANPAAPREFEPYKIHIQVKLPSNTKVYSKNDLSGTLFGTDDYRQVINQEPEHQFFYFTPGSGFAEYVMLIPGAELGVNDRIEVRSRLINEAQTISITFN